MKIIVNGRFLIHRITGVERYARELLNQLDKIVNREEIVLAIPPEVEEVPQYQNIRVIKVGRLHNQLWEHISFPRFVKKQKGISLNLCNVAPLSSPDIVCIHDVKVKATPQYFSKKFIMWYNLLFTNETRRARQIVTVSEFSKSEIIKYFKVDTQKIAVVPNAWQHYERIDFDENALKKYNITKNNYVFSMCSLEPNKNFRWIAENARRNPNILFVVAGAINKKVFLDGLGFECPNNMKLLGYISDEEAKTLMRDCKVFLFPTFYEGFGIPPLEAMSAGAKNIYVSDTPVMHEIFENSVHYVNPHDLTTSIDFLSEKDKCKVDAESILKKYSWNKSALLMKKILDRWTDKNENNILAFHEFDK